MRFVKFIREEHFPISSDYAYWVLGEFLRDGTGSAELVEEWLSDPRSTSLSSNIAEAEKIAYDLLVVGYQCFMDLSEEAIEDIKRKTGVDHVQQNIFISPEDLLHILYVWELHKEYCFSEMWIKNDNGVFWGEVIDPIKR
jgi:hypothetical protein